MEERIYIDWMNDNKEIKFFSDATQSFIDCISFNEWYVVKHMLIENGYMVIESSQLN